jgi:UDP-N-acetylmuramyl pentapeptide phosphotransferase/UDP-N-acetylglucosamine-1-phosphate transferase
MYLIIFAAIFVLSFTATFLIRGVAIKKNIMDIPNVRSSHVRPTPRGGGLAVAIAWFIGLLALFMLKEVSISLLLALMCGIPIAVMGLIDDIISISPGVRLITQFIFTSLAVLSLGGFDCIDLGFSVLSIPLLFSVIAVVGVVWLINLFNFLDGIDGYLGLEIIFICLAAFLLLGVKLPLILAASSLGFLVWNWQPAKIFMGDVGSTLLGFTIGIFAIHFQNTGESSVFIWIMLTSLFWFDATVTLFRRFKKNEKLSVAHKKHAYQRIVQYGFSHQKTVIWSFIINLAILLLAWLGHRFPTFILLIFCINILILYAVMQLVDKKLPFR